jgi:membrane-associated phospholipid phosphatase
MINFLVSLDHYVFQLINGFAGTKTLDYLARYEEQGAGDLVKGGLFMMLYWYFWFKRGPERPRRRETITAIFIGVIFSLLVCRALADLAPFRDRPMYADTNYRHTSVPVDPNIEDWSAFPSDQAGYFFALATGILLLSRLLGLTLIVYSAVFICLTRIYLGLHYPSDILVGAGIGMSVVAITAHSRFIRERLAAPINRVEELSPGVFYAGLFLMSFEMAEIFHHIRGTVHQIVKFVHST